MKVYLIVTGEYEDRQTAAVTTSEGDAQYLKMKYSNECEEAVIEVYDTEEEINEDVNPFWRLDVRKKDGAIIRAFPFLKKPSGFTIYENVDTFLVYVQAESETEAEKKADKKIKDFVSLERKIQGATDDFNNFKRQI